jgi:putative redox protein
MNIKTELLVTADAAIGREHYRTTIKSANQTIYADEPASNNGTDTGMNPHSLLLSSLGSCTAITLRMYADRKMWPVEEIAVHLEFYRTNEGTRIDRQISFKGDITEEQHQKLIQIANACPIHKVLTGHIEVITS